MPEKVCPCCQQPFLARKPGQVYCSRRCTTMNRWGSTPAEVKTKPKEIKACRHCQRVRYIVCRGLCSRCWRDKTICCQYAPLKRGPRLALPPERVEFYNEVCRDVFQLKDELESMCDLLDFIRTCTEEEWQEMMECFDE
jgi:hypothetical protein